jgi:UDP-N-acetylglucosamine transferase subunit ALG13
MARGGKRRRSFVLGSRFVIFVTVGSMFPFDRMISMMDDWALQNPRQQVLAQIGGGKYEPKYMRWNRILAPNAYKQTVQSSQLIVAHAGTGSVFTACTFCKPIVLVPRRAAEKEHTTDHQLDTARWLENKPGIFVAWSEDDLGQALERAENSVGNIQSLIDPFAPQAFIDRIRNFLVTS